MIEEFEEDKSKSQVKRELQELKDLGRQLIDLPIKELKKLELEDELLDAIINSQTMSHGALKRQTGYIGGLIAKSDFQSIQTNLAKLKQVHHGEVKQFHQLEQWRDDLLSGNAEIITLLHNQFIGQQTGLVKSARAFEQKNHAIMLRSVPLLTRHTLLAYDDRLAA